jgi:aminopeptidase-like protein
MSIGELVIQGESSKEFLISSYICHPSMANDSLSGLLLAAYYAAHILESHPKYSYRFIWVPETIGAITYLANNENIMKNIDCGLVITTCGGPGNFSLKKSWDENHYLNGLILEVLKDNDINPDVYVFDMGGSDERQYSTQGFRINTPLLCKSKFYEYDEYHTSLDNLDFVLPCYLSQSFDLYIDIYNKLESLEFYRAEVTHGEAMLSKRKAYPSIGGRERHSKNSCVTPSSYLLWFMFYADGNTPLSSIAEKLKLEVSDTRAIAQDLERLKIASKV